MTKIRFTLQALTLVLLTLVFASFAQAQATRTWVSGVGNDADPCSRTAPCKTFSGAISKTFINGEIDVLDPGGFGTLSITKSITVDGTGTFASVLASGTNGFSINIATNVNDPLRNVTLRGISINGAGASGAVGTRTGIQGVNISTNGANNVWIEDCVIFNFTQNGINANNPSSLASVNIFLKNDVIRDNGGAGIFTASTNGSIFVRASADHCHFTGNANGIKAGSNSRIFATQCLLDGNSSNGLLVLNTTAGLVSAANLKSCQVSTNLANGVQSGGAGSAGTSIARIGDNEITGNLGNGVLVSTNGSVFTYQDNYLTGNNTDGCPSCVTSTPPKN
jgi:hypothetical protein